MRSNPAGRPILAVLALLLMTVPTADAAGSATANLRDYQGHYDNYLVTQSIPPPLVYSNEIDTPYHRMITGHWGGQQQSEDKFLGLTLFYYQKASSGIAYKIPTTEVTYDMTFCHPTLTTMSVAINLRVAGTVAGNVPKAGMRLLLQEGSSGDVTNIGVYTYPPGSGSYWGPAGGAFANITTPSFSGVFTSPTFSVPASPTGVTVPIRVQINVSKGSLARNEYSSVDFGSPGSSEGVGFAIDAPVFTLPEGGCVNSVDARIILAPLGASPLGAEQGEFSWNRRALDLTTVPAAGGTHDIVFRWSFEFDGTGTVLDLGTEAEFSWGVPLGSPECIIWDIKDSCTHACAADSCGTTVIDGVATTLTCGSTDDLCHGPELVGVVPAVPLQPGDVITVTLLPAAGGAPEGDTSDDSLSLAFGPTAVHSKSWGAVKKGYR
jgi:hypothetical protein